MRQFNFYWKNRNGDDKYMRIEAENLEAALSQFRYIYGDVVITVILDVTDKSIRIHHPNN